MGERERDLEPNADGWSGPRRFDDFEVVRPLGQGGMGHVFLGHDVNLDRPVALKVTATADPSQVIRARFLREARAIARLSHPNVVGIYRVGEVAGRPYLAYEFVKGDDLSSLRTPMPWTRVVRIALGLARGLAAAHRAGVLHRDIKPSNAMLTPAGDVKLLDFGLARFADAETSPSPARTRTSKPVIVDPVGQTQPLRGSQHHITNAGAVLGTPAYMPPEIWRNETATERSDLYSLGLVLFELLTGTLPHGGTDAAINFESVLLLDPPSVRSKSDDVLPSFADLVDACIRREPADRPASADVLVESLERMVSLFVPASLAAAPLREDRDADLVSQSYERVVMRGDEITDRVYAKLFAMRPDLRPLFPLELDAQRQKLSHALKLSIAGLGNHGGLLPVLQDLGRRHARFGLGADEYAVLTDAVVATIRELDSKIDDEITHAWRRAFAFVTNTMRSAANSSDVTHDEPPAEASPAAMANAPVESTPSPRNVTPASIERPPATRYAFVEEHGIAYQVLGQGSPDLLLHLGRVSHLEHGWRHPKLADWLRALASMGRLVMLDKRGTGLSERVVQATNLQTRVEDPIAVLDAVDTRRAVFVGVGEGAATALLTAAFFPERVRGVVCINGSTRMLSAPGYPGGLDPAFLDRAIERIRTQWGDALFVESEAPSMAGDPEFATWFGDYLRAATSPGTAIAQLKLNAAFDARWILPSIRVPVLVIHRADNRLIRSADGRYIADQVRGARYVEVPGGDHLPFTGEVEPVLDAIHEFTWDSRLDAAPPPGLVTVALLRGDEGTDESLLARFTARFEAIGARRIPHADENELLVAGPWFVSMAQVASEIVATPAARSWGVRVALHAAVLEEREAREPLMTALHDAVAAAGAGECVLSEELQSICLREQRPRSEPIVTSVGTRFV